ncbi:MAG TPA: aldo/keto reductase [Steroidobacteraceae bacterium]|nr:aldo/keto reductase [Steroidobacteraceae bacterium]
MSIATRPLGTTATRLGALGFGCMGLVGWYGTRDDAESERTLLAAIDRGVDHLDTASSYQGGENERFVGATIRAVRERVFLASKFGITRTSDGTVVIDNRPESVRAAVEQSLTRLGTDRIDLYYLHRIDRSVPIEESVGALGALVRAGKIRHIGLSECSITTLRRACAVHPIAAVQSEYSLWSREPEAGMLEACRELGVSLVAYSPLGRGFLAGNFRTLEELPAADLRRNQPRFEQAHLAHNARIAEGVRALADRKGCTPAQLALAWVLAQGEEVLPIPGMKTRAHLTDNLDALEVIVTPEERAGLHALVERIGVRGERYPPAMLRALGG